MVLTKPTIIELDMAKPEELLSRAEAALDQEDYATIKAVIESYAYLANLVEPNSALGDAISCLLKYWEKLTLFLRVPGAPLDNNIRERALKKAILHRKNALFYKTCRGAHVGDIFMSLIYTCELCGTNPFDYLTELERHADRAASNPRNWMPWNYRETLDHLSAPAASGP
jgi:hypothetical protein